MLEIEIPANQLPETVKYCKLLANSFFCITGMELLSGFKNMSDIELAKNIFSAKFALVSHGVEADPIFRYANNTALTLWEINWAEFTKMPSRLSAQNIGDVQNDRNKLLQTAMEKGFVDNYEGVRISKNGNLFEIKNTILWNVVDDAGKMHGQAALIKNWKHLEKKLPEQSEKKTEFTR